MYFPPRKHLSDYKSLASNIFDSLLRFPPHSYFTFSKSLFRVKARAQFEVNIMYRLDLLKAARWMSGPFHPPLYPPGCSLIGILPRLNVVRAFQNCFIWSNFFRALGLHPAKPGVWVDVHALQTPMPLLGGGL